MILMIYLGVNMCSSGAMYLDEDDYLQIKDKEFYQKNSEEWDYYSGLPNPKAYEEKNTWM